MAVAVQSLKLFREKKQFSHCVRAIVACCSDSVAEPENGRQPQLSVRISSADVSFFC